MIIEVAEPMRMRAIAVIDREVLWMFDLAKSERELKPH